MKKKLPFIVASLTIIFSLYWLANSPKQIVNTKNSEISVTDKAPQVVTPGAVLNNVNNTQDKNLTKIPESLPIEKVAPPIPAISPQELTALKTQAAEMNAELLELASELDKNLEIKEKRREIENKFKLRTEEYNKVVLQLVKAESHSAEYVIK